MTPLIQHLVGVLRCSTITFVLQNKYTVSFSHELSNCSFSSHMKDLKWNNFLCFQHYIMSST